MTPSGTGPELPAKSTVSSSPWIRTAARISIGCSKPSIGEPVAVLAVGQGGDPLPHRSLRAGDDLLGERLDVREPELVQEPCELPGADLVADDLGVEVAQYLFGRADVGGDHLVERLDRAPRVVELHHRDGEPFLEHRPRVRREAAPADVEGVARVGEERHDAAAPEDRRGDRDVVQLGGRLPGVVGDEDIPRLQRVDWEAREEVDHPGRHRVDVPRRAGDRLGDHAPLTVEHPRREVAGLADDGREGRAHERSGLLVDGGDQPAPEDVEGDLIHGRSRGRRV